MNKLQCPVLNKVKLSPLSPEMESSLYRAAEVYRNVHKISLEEALMHLAVNENYPIEARQFFAKLAAQAKF